MSEYYYAYPFDRTIHDQSYAFWNDGFSDKEIKNIIKLGESENINQAGVVGGDTDIISKNIRDSKISWINPSDESIWLYDKICDISSRLNNQYFGYNLSGLLSIQYTVYESNSEGGGFYDWHVDRIGLDKKYVNPRKLSISIQLSDPMDYEGGELWINGQRRECLSKNKGMLFAFPSHTLHRVTPVTSGIRKSLVAWIVGPDFV
jgi:PKHD-type hydroxylase